MPNMMMGSQAGMVDRNAMNVMVPQFQGIGRRLAKSKRRPNVRPRTPTGTAAPMMQRMMQGPQAMMSRNVYG